MKTKKALSILSGVAVDSNSLGSKSLLDNKDKFMDAYEARERSIAAKKELDAAPLPFLESLRRKVSKLVESPDVELPVVTRFDLYSGVKKLAERAPNDTGLNRLTKHLEAVWHKDPLGAITYGQVSELVKHYKDMYPRSKSADALQAECVRVGLHKLPVAKLARIAANITTQSDFDTAIEAAGYAGSKPDQVRARTLVRELVAMRGAKLAAEKVVDRRTAHERVTDHLAQLDNLIDEEPVTDELPVSDEMPLPEEMDSDIGQEMPEAFGADEPNMDIGEQDVEQGVDIVEQIGDAAEEIIQSAPPEAKDYITHEMNEGQAAVGTAEWGAQEMLEGHEAPPPTEAWLQEEMEELGLESPMGMPTELEVPELGTSGTPMGGLGATAAKGNGIPLPKGKIKTQLGKPQGSAKDLGKDGGQVLKASEIESALLDGKKIKFAGLSIAINDQDEVELWNKEAGKACSILDLDTAIADFMRQASKLVLDRAARKINAFYHIAQLVSVPCEECASVVTFEKSASDSDMYVCDCGFELNADTVAELSKIGGSYQDYSLEITWAPAQDIAKQKDQYRRIMSAIQGAGTAQVYEDEKGYIKAAISSTDEMKMDQLKKALASLGAQPVERRVGQLSIKAQLDAGPMDMPLPGGPMPEPSGQAKPVAPPPVEDALNESSSLSDLMNAHFMLAKEQEVEAAEAIQQFLSKFKDKALAAGPEFPALLNDAVSKHYLAPVGATPEEPMPMDQLDAPAMPMAAAVRPLMAQSLKMPKVRKPSDKVQVGKDVLGKDSEEKDLLPSPGKIKTQLGKPQGNFSDTNLGKDSEGQDLMPNAGKPSLHPNKPKNKSLSDTNLGHDSEGDEPFKTPKIGK